VFGNPDAIPYPLFETIATKPPLKHRIVNLSPFDQVTLNILISPDFSRSIPSNEIDLVVNMKQFMLHDRCKNTSISFKALGYIHCNGYIQTNRASLKLPPRSGRPGFDSSPLVGKVSKTQRELSMSQSGNYPDGLRRREPLHFLSVDKERGTNRDTGRNSYRRIQVERQKKFISIRYPRLKLHVRHVILLTL
jgi:hypothetical protein